VWPLEHGEEGLDGRLQVQGRVAGVVLQGLHPTLYTQTHRSLDKSVVDYEV